MMGTNHYLTRVASGEDSSIFITSAGTGAQTRPALFLSIPEAFATGPMQPADPTERGFKDTVKANPGEFTTIRAKYDLPTGVTAPQTYVYHCHILEHEDNDMMRPFTVVP
jgi:FtsP/CotA-like multicopper oxidase with cupredoxin domain